MHGRLAAGVGLLLATALLAGCEADEVSALTRRVDTLEATVDRLQHQAALSASAGSGATAAPPPAPATQWQPAVPAPNAPTTEDPIAEAAGPPRYALHLASYRRPADVGRGWRTLKAGYPRLLGGLQPRVAAVNFGDRRGTFYRLIAGPYPTRPQAEAACARVRAAGLYCAVEEFMGTPGEAFWQGL